MQDFLDLPGERLPLDAETNGATLLAINDDYAVRDSSIAALPNILRARLIFHCEFLRRVSTAEEADAKRALEQAKKWEEENPLFITDENLLNQWQKMVKEIIGPEQNAKTKEKDMVYIKKQLANTIPVKFALKNK